MDAKRARLESVGKVKRLSCVTPSLDLTFFIEFPAENVRIRWPKEIKTLSDIIWTTSAQPFPIDSRRVRLASTYREPEVEIWRRIQAMRMLSAGDLYRCRLFCYIYVSRLFGWMFLNFKCQMFSVDGRANVVLKYRFKTTAFYNLGVKRVLKDKSRVSWRTDNTKWLQSEADCCRARTQMRRG